MISKDSTLFKTGENTFGDARKRHISYAQILRRYSPESNIDVIVYTEKGNVVENIGDGLTLYPTNSRCRICFVFDVVFLLFKHLYIWKPDLITVQTPDEEGIIGYLVSKILKVKFLTQVHYDCFSEKWLNEKKYNIIRQKITKFILRNSDKVRVVSSGLKQKMHSLWNISLNKIEVIPVGVNFIACPNNKEFYKKKICKELAGKKTVLFVGRFCETKNLTLWVLIAKAVITKIPEANFIMVGDGELRCEIEKQVNEFEIDKNFTFLGNVGHEKLPFVYAAADVFLLTSHDEGFGRVIIESYLSGVPVVSTSSVGPCDLILNEHMGYLKSSEDFGGLVESVVFLLKNEKTSNEMGLVGKKIIEEKFLFSEVSERLVQSWLSLFSSRKAGKNA